MVYTKVKATKADELGIYTSDGATKCSPRKGLRGNILEA